MEELDEIMKAFSELDLDKLTFNEKIEMIDLFTPVVEFARRMAIKYSSDMPSGSTFFFRMGDIEGR